MEKVLQMAEGIDIGEMPSFELVPGAKATKRPHSPFDDSPRSEYISLPVPNRGSSVMFSVTMDGGDLSTPSLLPLLLWLYSSGSAKPNNWQIQRKQRHRISPCAQLPAKATHVRMHLYIKQCAHFLSAFPMWSFKNKKAAILVWWMLISTIHWMLILFVF